MMDQQAIPPGYTQEPITQQFVDQLVQIFHNHPDRRIRTACGSLIVELVLWKDANPGPLYVPTSRFSLSWARLWLRRLWLRQASR